MSASLAVEPHGTFAPGDLGYHVAQALRWLIHREDQQQNHVAIAAGMGPDELSRCMTGKEQFAVADLFGLAEALGTTAPNLIALAVAFQDGDDPEEVLAL